MELIVWGSTMAILVSSAFRARGQLKSARSNAGDIKPGSTGPRIWTNLAFLGQSGGLYLLPLVYWSATASNKFHQPEWMTEYALPPSTDVFGVDSVTVGRTVGLLGVLTGAVLTRTALKALGDPCSTIGVSALFSRGLPDTNRLSGLQIREKPRLVDHGPFAYVRHPIYTRVSLSPSAEPSPYDPHTQREPYYQSLSRPCILVISSSLRPSTRDRWVPTKGAD